MEHLKKRNKDKNNNTKAFLGNITNSLKRSLLTSLKRILMQFKPNFIILISQIQFQDL
jgi:hypothetical protein